MGHILPGKTAVVFRTLADENRQKQGKEVEKVHLYSFYKLSPLILHRIN